MRRLYTKIKSNFEKDIFKFKESNYDFVRFHIGTNSICLTLVFFFAILVSFKADVLHWNYLKGISEDLSFYLGLFSIVFGVWFYNYWRLSERSVYSIHFAKTKYIPKDVVVLFVYNDFTFGVGRRIWVKTAEFSPTTRAIFCVLIFLCLGLTTVDNSGLDKLKKLPIEILQPNSDFCPDKEESIENAPQKEGCELIIRAYKLGYAKELGSCASETVDPEDLEVCQKRRKDEPFFHYMSRLLTSSIKSKLEYFDTSRIKNIEDKFNLQLGKLEDLRDYQTYAISAAPRASHHIWTNLPYPENSFIQNYREIFQPNYCIQKFQNQTNTISLEKDDKRKYSKLLEHIYGQLLFNPKSKVSVGLCKEYKIHWESETNICEKIIKNPKLVFEEESILSEIELVLRRHDIANVILNLDEKIQKIESDGGKAQITNNDSGDINEIKLGNKTNVQAGKKSKNKIVKNKIAKDIQQIRKKKTSLI
jgi:hypothetical protein